MIIVRKSFDNNYTVVIEDMQKDFKALLSRYGFEMGFYYNYDAKIIGVDEL